MKNQPFLLKTFIIIALSTCYSSHIFSQSDDREYYSANKDVSIYTSEFQKGKTAISNYILKNNADVLSENLSRYDYRVDFSIDQKQFLISTPSYQHWVMLPDQTKPTTTIN